MALVRCAVLARLRHGHLVDGVPDLRGRNRGHIDPRLPGPGVRADVRGRPVAGLRRRMGGRLLHAGSGLRHHTVDHRRADDLHTGVAILSHDDGQIGRGGRVLEEVQELRRRGVRKRAGNRPEIRYQ